MTPKWTNNINDIIVYSHYICVQYLGDCCICALSSTNNKFMPYAYQLIDDGLPTRTLNYAMSIDSLQ